MDTRSRHRRRGLLFAATLPLLLAGCPRGEVTAPRGDAASAAVVERRPATAADVDALLAPHAARIAAGARPRIAIALEPMAADDVRASKVGGRPYWADGRAFPRDEDGRPLVLLAQVDLAALPAVDDGLPDAGLLQFFIAAGDLYGARFGDDGAIAGRGRGHRVVYWPDAAAAAVAVPSPGGRHADMLPHDPAAPRAMRFRAGSEALTVADHRFDTLFDGGLSPALRAFADARGIDDDALFERLGERHGGQGHKLGGHPFFTQQDPRRAGDGLELLLQLDTDAAMMWGDSGVGGFFITAADLAARDFDRVFYSWDCY